MPFAKPLSQPRSRTQIEPARQIIQRSDAEREHARVIALLPVLREGRPVATPSVTARAFLALSHFAEHTFPNLLLAVVSWVVRETLDGCAAYAEALYGVPFSELGEPAPVEIASHEVPRQLSLVAFQVRNDAGGRQRPASAVAAAHVDGEVLHWRGSWQENWHESLPGKKRGRLSRWRTAISIFIVASGSRIRLARERRQAIAELRGFDDRSLRDIGISASEIEYIVWRDTGRE